MKKCKACNLEKPLKDFSVRTDSKDGYRNICKLCTKHGTAIGKVIDEIGNTYGKWKVLSRSANKEDGSAKWNCICECGKEKVIPASTLREGTSKSCGCGTAISGRAKRDNDVLEKRTLRSYRAGAGYRGYEFQLTLEDVKTLIYKDCFYCGDAPSTTRSYYGRKGIDKSHFIITNGIDRRNNTENYTLSNCVPCCTTCNQIKSDLTLENFMDKVVKIYKNKDNICQIEH